MTLGNPLTLALLGWLAMALAMAVLYAVGRARGNHALVDVGWAAGMGVLALAFAALIDGDPARRAVVGLLAAVWGLRLATHLVVHRVLGRGEDGRYSDMREALGTRAEPVFFVFYQIQAFWAILFSVPILVALSNPRAGLGVWDAVGVAIWLVAVAGETLADRQLAAFRKDPANRGRTCRVGLWRTSRHPNYFFEWIHWFAYVAFAIGSGWWWLALGGPLVMIVFLFKVTGIPWVEKRALQNKPDYRDYIETTSVFIPMPPRSRTS